ncbi:hypothetical protein BATDEDRAFT_92526 [Batrachochytrium dendrobatidis JAM81]|uniref:Nucleoporin Nup133/Nup155-like N-terminal domain-containing protein n=1 Tax=Batrachochytrium dendrobatidis (strain JAM81 / FGSC 10211) TaxID=684364 RepID=F4PDV1_BATDJ|nr:uncharacterized protein BATDEDRAFT_92526 [Batrachochytrium dendrobatidis JAM81]EGF76462.1 hypothetical protein BATDEDRAFT_92526 [Batrachochytrium dendrobatidis JAM81]|eukprot:XP_006682879.1 hypothetical protein BATDEDRAFT_92526 [Batrachochytrium dendrobatidis JAM81]
MASTMNTDSNSATAVQGVKLNALHQAASLLDMRAAKDCAINTFDDQEQIIISAALVKPILGVFLEQIEYVLVVATPLEIILLGVAFSKKGQDGVSRGSMSIYRTDMSIASDGVNMTSIFGTDTGRIFMRGNNGQLYELEYESQDGWLTRKIRKINRTSSGIISYIPTFLLWGGENAVKLATVDNNLKALYTISPTNDVSVYSLGPDGKGMTRVATISDLFSRTIGFSAFIPQSALDEPKFEIVSIYPVSLNESRQIHMVAVTSTGIRLYFSCTQHISHNSYMHDSNTIAGPTGLRLVFALGPPVVSQGLSSYNVVGSAKIHEAFYANGLLIASQSFSDEVDRVIGVSMNCGMMAQTSPMFLSELGSFVDVDGKTWAIAEASTKPSSKDKHSVANTPGMALNELAMQFEYPARRFHLLTNMGLSTISKLRPIDLLVQLLKHSNGQDLRGFEDFFITYGKDQSCAMSLGIACDHSSIKSGPTDILLPAVVALATRLFFEFGGKATLIQSQPHLSGGGPLGVPVSTFEVHYSAKHDGLALYLLRALRPIWTVELIQKKYRFVFNRKAADGSEKWEATQSIQDLILVQMNLASLDKFLNKYPRFTALPTPDTRPSGVDPEAWKKEQESLANMHELIRQSLETISFVSLLIDYKLPSMIAGMTESEKRELKGFTFQSLVSSSKGRDIGKMLMTSLVNKQIEKDIGVDIITATLQQRCPSICQTNEVMFFKGIECIQKAKQAVSRNEQLTIIGEALKLFMSVVKHIHFEKLRTVVESFKSLQYYTGVVDLALVYAAEQDTTESLNLDNISSRSYYRRIESYRLIFGMLASIDDMIAQPQNSKYFQTAEDMEAIKAQVFARAVASSDQAFHTSLYDWLIEQGRHTDLLQIQSPYLEDYLIANKSDLNKAEYLCQYYARNSRFSEAAKICSFMAQSPGLLLSRRIEYLTKAVTNAKSSAGHEFGGNQELLNQITDDLDVARLQFEIYNRVSVMPNTEHALNDLNYNLHDVTLLFHNYARPYQMHDLVLAILHIADHGVQVRGVVESAWIAIFYQTKEEALATGRSPIEALGDKIEELGRRFYPNDNVFPLGFLINKLEQETYEFEDDSSLHKGWVVDALRGINVPFSTIFNTFNGLFETKLPPWSSNKALAFLIQEILVLLEKWLKHVRTLPTTSYEKEDFPIPIVDEAISKYLVTIHADETQIVDALHKIQSQLRRAF